MFATPNCGLYHYAANNPVRYTDPTGMYEQDHVNKIYTFDIRNKSDFDDVACIMMDMQKHGYRARGVDKTTGEITEFSSYAEMLKFSISNDDATNIVCRYISPVSNKPIEQKTGNQNKVEKDLYAYINFVEMPSGDSLSLGAGINSVSSELNEKSPVYIQWQIDIINAFIDIDLSGKSFGFGYGANLISVSGKIGGKNVRVGGSVGFGTGFEMHINFTQKTWAVEGKFIKGARFEGNWD